MYKSGQLDYLAAGHHQDRDKPIENLLEYLQTNNATNHLSLISLWSPLSIFIYAVYYVIQVFWSFAVKLYDI